MESFVISLLRLSTVHIGLFDNSMTMKTRLKKNRKLQLDELKELRNDAFKNAKISKHKMKTLHDKHILRKSFHVGQKVLLYNSRLHLFPGKLRTKWIGPFEIKSISEHGAFEE